MFLWLSESNLKYYLLKDNRICGMNFYFHTTVDGFNDTIPNYDINNFTIKDNIPPKVQHVLTSALFSKSVYTWK